MVQLITTYRNDYGPPITTRAKFLMDLQNKTEECKDVCDCCKEFQVQGPPKTLEEAKKTHLRMEWTGVAPIGRLVEPRINPPAGDINLSQSKQTAASKCMEDQPNRFLRVLDQCYPNLYDRLRYMQEKELTSRLNTERLKTTYQIEFCRVPEFPDGLYDFEAENQEDHKFRDTAEIVDGCSHFKKPDNLKRINFKPSSKIDDKCPAKKYVDETPLPSDYTSHWSTGNEYSKKIRVKDNLDKLSRNNCIIQNKTKDCDECGNGKSCLEKLKKACKTLK